MKQRILIVNSGGDCPGMNAVIRAVVKRAALESNWEIIGSIDGFDGILSSPYELKFLDEKSVSGIIVKGGTFLMTNNKRNPFNYPVKKSDNSIKYTDVTDQLIKNLKDLNISSIIHIGGNESHKISYQLSKKGVNIVGVPKTINNDLSITDYSFGFQSAVQIATEAVDKLVTTANSHNRVLILEVMGRNTGWIALHAAIAGGADVCLIPEIPFTIEKIIEKLESRYSIDGRGFANIVVAEGARFKDENLALSPGLIAREITARLKKKNFNHDIRETILGHLQRGGVPMAFDRILATELGVKAFETILEKKFGTMTIHKNGELTNIPLEKVIDKNNKIETTHNLIQTAKGIGISFGD